MPYLRRLVFGLPPEQIGFEHRTVQVGFLGDKVAAVCVSLNASAVPDNCYSANAPYFNGPSTVDITPH